MKRERSGEVQYDGEVIDHESMDDMAKCLMLLSKVGSNDTKLQGPPRRVFTCKTCNREFPSFQALGGHRASHKKPRMLTDPALHSEGAEVASKPKTHECSICGLEFPIGQALGGHMRRHRGELAAAAPAAAPPSQRVPVLKKSASSKRVTTWCLDLNLSPLENDLRMILLGKAAPPINFVV
ncbi:zinc finger protein ZAT12-like [Punica granatum]|uniref:C2H2-type domain-containing protein n=2 Tax=Punica granatum TaxID=22663 RepID=A0A218XVW5_PUNGR|nr:zinc finger protein ZAT12-like [Punica granatum]OWM89315.1 hypothetical protein CDL15_Pgr024060 [Punica granatum]PKI61682.1 hypothetical protein CRG98_017906 [Punica granatum]